MNFVSLVYEALVPTSRETCRLLMTMIGALILCIDLQEYILRIKKNTYTSVVFRGTRCRNWLSHCATCWKVAGSIPVSLEFFIDIILPASLWPWD